MLRANAPVPAQEDDVCLRIADLERIHMMNNHSAVADDGRDAFNVAFWEGCTVASNVAFFVFHRDRLGLCLGAGDVLEASDGTACVVEEVKRLHDISLQDAQVAPGRS